MTMWPQTWIEVVHSGQDCGPRLQDMDSMVGTTLTIEREMEDTRGIRDASAGGKRKED